MVLHFLQPVWLWAGAAIAAPILIHLWNVKRGKTLKVGSVLLFTEGAPSGKKKRRLSQLLLLLLRCLLLLFLALLIAKPIWLQHANAKEKGWLLIPPNELHEAYQFHQQLIDSLLRQGYALHDFDTTLREENLLERMKQKDAATDDVSSFSYRELLKQIEDKIPSHIPVYIFTDNELKHFTGARFTSSLPVTWRTFPASDTSSVWLEKAYRISADSVRVITGNSQPSSTHFLFQNLSLGAADQQYKNISHHLYAGSLNNGSASDTTGIDTASFRVVIYAKTFAGDAAYVQAALQAIADFTQYNIKVYSSDDIKEIRGNCNWLFWLSDEAIPPTIQADNTLMYVAGNVNVKRSVFVAGNRSDLTTSEPIVVYKRIANSDAASSQTVWTDAMGSPLLSRSKMKKPVYLFYSHFNPQWNDLVWHSSFPQILFELLFPIEKSNTRLYANDKRVIDTTQIQPAFAADSQVMSHEKNDNGKDVSLWVWLAAFFIFIAERLLSFHTTRKRA